MDILQVKELGQKIEDNINNVIIGRKDTVHMVVASLLAGGNILLEEVPGSGKTMLAKVLALSVGGEFKRIQMTPDLLPADVTGINFYNVKNSEFEFIKGPVFTNILIADEINRATPKTQAGLLECMEEKQVTVDGKTYALEDTFMVIATENPIDSQGVFPLPEAQLDRFLMKLTMSYPEHEDMMTIMKTHMKGYDLSTVKCVASKEDISEAKAAVTGVAVHDDIVEYVVNLTEATRRHDKLVLGVSQRGALGIIKISQAIAALDGRDYVLPDDVKDAFKVATPHRVILKNSERLVKGKVNDIVAEILGTVPVPTEMI
ncbi:MAG: MoxR family ATPase [Lachnospiraceae bacterium]|nr:MoxR family ATPase [Lachnospiraceae bacterium]